MIESEAVEKVRLREFASYCGPAPAPDSRFLRLTQLARQQFHVPMAMVNLIDGETLWPKAEDGTAFGPLPRESTLCNLVMHSGEPVILPDLAHDPAFADSLAVTGPNPLGFYAGAPMRAESGRLLGVMCVLDRQARPDFDTDSVQRLQLLADLAVDQLALDRAQRQEKLNLLAAENLARSRTDFLEKVNEELRQPLTTALGFSEMLTMEPLPEPQAEYARILHDSAQSLGEVVKDALEYARLDAGLIELEVMDFPLSDLIRRCLWMVEGPIRAKGLTMQHHVDAGAPELVRGDPMRMQQVLGILLSNAVKFTTTATGTGTVTLSALPGATVGGLRLEVTDSGVGVPPEHRDELFKPISRQEAAARHPHGFDLDLAIARQLVVMMGGTIGYRPAKSGGSTFWFDLPYPE